MARIRTIKPEFFTSATVARLSYRARLTWQGIWTQVDDGGRMRYDPRVLAGAIWPQEDEVTWREVTSDVDELLVAGVVVTYGPEGEYLAVTNWHEHQRINKPTASKVPPPPRRDDSGSTPGVVTEEVFHSSPVENTLPDPYRGEGEREVEREREVEGRADAPTTPFCFAHPSGTERPCRACQAARVAFEEHHKPKPRATVSGIITDPDCDIHPGRPRIGCDRCAEERATS